MRSGLRHLLHFAPVIAGIFLAIIPTIAAATKPPAITAPGAPKKDAVTPICA